jgi:hypothetical protein
VSAASNPGWYSGAFSVSPASAVRCPPAEPPVMQIISGSTRSSSALPRTHAIARLTSMIWSGNVASGLSR